MAKSVLKSYTARIAFASICVMLFAGLEFWNSFSSLPAHKWNPREISRIKVTDPEDFTFAVCGDNQGVSYVFEPLLRDINKSRGIAFLIDNGDLVNVAKKGQFQCFLDEVRENLAIPLVTAIGNRDIHKNSSDIYKEIFGPTYYAFQVGQNYFIVLDRCKEEAGLDEEQCLWLERELKKSQTFQARFVFMHVPVLDPRKYDSDKFLHDKGRDLIDLFRNYKVTHLFAGHIHGYFSGAWEGVPYTITGGAGGRLAGNDPEHFFHHYIKVHISKGHVETKVIRIDTEGTIGCVLEILTDFIIENDLIGWSLLLGAGISLFSLGLSIRREHSSK